MFTGLIESVGVVSDVAPGASGVRLRVSAPLASELQPGESLAVNGVCLTVVSAAEGAVQSDIGPETARVSQLRIPTSEEKPMSNLSEDCQYKIFAYGFFLLLSVFLPKKLLKNPPFALRQAQGERRGESETSRIIRSC